MSFAWAKPYEPKSGFTKWLDQRLPLPLRQVQLAQQVVLHAVHRAFSSGW